MSVKNKIEIVAEVAQGYEGNIKLTELLTTAAILSGADAVKFQLVYADCLRGLMGGPVEPYPKNVLACSSVGVDL